MAAFGFWNIDSLRRLEKHRRALPRLAAELAYERSLDVLFLLECEIPYPSLLAAFQGGPAYFPIESADHFRVLARFDPKFMERLPLPVPTNRFDIWRLMLPEQEEVLISAVHGHDQRNNSQEKNALLMRQLVAALVYCEGKVRHDRTVVLGDFNANPFESPVASAVGMNAVMSRTIAQSKPRRIASEHYSYFYNPMWTLYGDEPRSSAPATYYYHGSDTHELYWHMFDQVLCRPSLVTRFAVSTLEIVTVVHGTALTNSKGIPNRTRFSDHLPVVFQVDLLPIHDKGATHVAEPLA
jgi:endonuclease/exonuclease/phosphatase family metal-dependent hydrolase